MLVSVGVVFLVTTAVLGLLATGSRSVDRREREGNMGASGRTGLDEVLRELRAAREISAQETIGGTVFTSTGSNIVFRAPSYNAASPQGILDGFDDVLAFRYNAGARTVTQTTERDNAASDCPVRTGLVLARNVQSVRYLYRVRDQMEGNGTKQYVLRARTSVTADSPLTAYVNGSEVPVGAYDPATRTVTLGGTITPAAPQPATLSSSGTPGDDVQFQYTVDPAASPGDLGTVNGVDVVLTLSDTDGRRVQRTVTLAGNARLRNRRN